MSPLHLRRLKLLAVIGIFFYALILARLVSIQVFGHQSLDREARGQQTSRVILEPERGLIYDRQLRPLANNVDLSQISVRPAEVGRPRRSGLGRLGPGRGADAAGCSGRHRCEAHARAIYESRRK